MSQEESRPPLIEDLLNLCKELNSRHAKYIVIGGMAMIQQGFTRATEDVDILVSTLEKNEQRVIEGLSTLPDAAAEELKAGDIKTFKVIRIADEIVVDVMGVASGFTYEGAEALIEWVELNGVKIPFASAELLWKMKQGLREKDKIDRLFLERLLSKKKS